MRRGMRHAHTLGSKDPVFYKLFKVLLNEMKNSYPELDARKDLIIETLKNEETSRTFKLMEKRLFFYIMNPAMLLTWLFGILLIHSIGVESFSFFWFQLKSAMVLLLTFYHFFLFHLHANNHNFQLLKLKVLILISVHLIYFLSNGE